MQAPDISALVRRWSGGEAAARDQLVPILYEHLQRLAHSRLRGAPQESSLNTTGLVHEAYLRLVHASGITVTSRAHFLALASEIMRQLLVDRARARLAAKRGAGASPVTLDDELWLPEEDSQAIGDLNDALERLAVLNPRQSEILQHRYFGGLSLDETAEALHVSVATVKRELRSARAWLALELTGEPLGERG